MKKYWILPFIAALGIKTFAVYLAGSSITVFLDVISALIVFLIPLSLSFMYSTPVEFASYVGAAFSKRALETRFKEEALNYFHSLSKMLVLSGLLALMTGLIVIFRNIGEDGLRGADVGMGLSVAFLCVYYMISIKLFLIEPLAASLKKREEK